jgi:hypothetical protein
VREFWDDYRLRRVVWKFREERGADGSRRSGHFLEQQGYVTISLLLRDEDHYAAKCPVADRAIGIRNAKIALWKLLEDNAVVATGIDLTSGQRVTIPDYSWRDLEEFEERNKFICCCLGTRARRRGMRAFLSPAKHSYRSGRLAELCP